MNIILFTDNDSINSKTWRFFKNDERFLHIKKILKLSCGDVFKAGKINGKIGMAKIIIFNADELIFSFEEKINSVDLPKIGIILGFPRPIQLKRILRDISSLGFFELFLCGTELGEASYLKSNLSQHSQIEKYVMDGIIQSGQTLMPNFLLFSSIKKCLSKLESDSFFLQSKKFVLDVNTEFPSLNKSVFASDKPIIIAIGSERGWTDNERQLFFNAGFISTSMGERILRTETAITAALSIVLSNAGYWNK